MLFIKLLTCQCQWCTWHWDLPKMNYIFNSKTLMWDYSEIIQNQFISVGLLFQWLPCLQFCKINWYCCWSVLMLSSDVCNRSEIYMFRLESISGAGWSPEWVWNVKCDLLLPTEHSLGCSLTSDSWVGDSEEKIGHQMECGFQRASCKWGGNKAIT